MSLKTDIIDGVATALTAYVPTAVAEALEGQAEKADGSMAKAVLTLFADYARQEGTDGIDALASSVKKALESDDPRHIMMLATKHDALYMSNLVDALQSAEAEEKERCSKICAVVGAVIGDLSELIVSATIAAIRK
jgi:hypothetical protein